MAALKTQPNDGNVLDFINSVESEQKKKDSLRVLEIMQEITGAEPQMWGGSIVGFGRYSYTYASGKKGEWFVAGFSPRKQSLTLYIMSGFKRHGELLAKLGKHSTGRSCLYIKKLTDIDEEILKELIRESVAHVSN